MHRCQEMTSQLSLKSSSLKDACSLTSPFSCAPAPPPDSEWETSCIASPWNTRRIRRKWKIVNLSMAFMVTRYVKAKQHLKKACFTTTDFSAIYMYPAAVPGPISEQGRIEPESTGVLRIALFLMLTFCDCRGEWHWGMLNLSLFCSLMLQVGGL